MHKVLKAVKKDFVEKPAQRLLIVVDKSQVLKIYIDKNMQSRVVSSNPLIGLIVMTRNPLIGSDNRKHKHAHHSTKQKKTHKNAS